MCEYFKPLLVGLTIFLTSINSYAEDATVEWAPFVKAAGVSDQQLIKAADLVNLKFLVHQEGFIKRELVKKNDTEYADIIHWKTKANAITAGEKVNNCIQCGEYFKLMNMEASSTAGAGFSHYNILKTW